MMTKDERLSRIVGVIKSQGFISNSEIAEKFGVSEVTIRKDLNELEKKKILERTFGGAILNKSENEATIHDCSSRLNNYKNIDLKKKAKYVNLAEKAIQNIDDGDTIFLGSGTTCCILADMLPENLQISVVTNNLSAIESLLNKGIKIFLIGGEIATINGNTYFSSIDNPSEYLRSICVNKAFTSCYGIDVHAGITVESAISSYVFKALQEIQNSWYLMVSSEKFGKVGMYNICKINSIKKIIYDSMPEEILKYCLNNGIELDEI